MGNTNDDVFVFVLLIAIGVVFYFVPTIIALLKKKPNTVAIIALNFFLGWSIVGWVVALVWALSNPQVTTVVVQTQAAPVMATAPSLLCSNCGKYSVTGSAFCTSCGKALATA